MNVGKELSFITDNPDTYTKRLKTVSILLQCDLEVVTQLSSDVINTIYDGLGFLHGSHQAVFGQLMQIGRSKYSLIDFESMSLIEFLDLTYYFEEPDLYLDEIVSLCLRKTSISTSFVQKLSNAYAKRKQKGHSCKVILGTIKKVAKYNDDKDNYLCDTLSYVIGQQVAHIAMQFIKRTTEQFPAIYGNAEDKAHLENLQRYPHLAEKQKLIDADSEDNNWGLYDLISSICNNDKIQIDHWLSKSYKEFLNHASYVIEKQSKTK